jgi:hypothetical protein
MMTRIGPVTSDLPTLRKRAQFPVSLSSLRQPKIRWDTVERIAMKEEVVVETAMEAADKEGAAPLLR